jgi:hypothetical protein
MSKIVSIHQPDFMPWLGFFLKIFKSDIFILLDHVENNPRDSALWCRRVRICVNGRPSWLTIPIIKEKGRLTMPLNEMSLGVNSKAIKQLTNTYKKAPFFDEYSHLFLNYYQSNSSSLVERNMEFIQSVLEILNIQSKLIKSSAIVEQKLAKNELLIDLIKRMNGTVYLSGDGAESYQNDSAFQQQSIEVRKNNFVPLPYRQFNTEEFVPGLSILDVLFNIGAEETMCLLRKLNDSSLERQISVK